MARATTTTGCTVSQVGSCHEFMVAPTNGLVLGPDVTPVNPNERVAGRPSGGLIPLPRLP